MRMLCWPARSPRKASSRLPELAAGHSLERLEPWHRPSLSQPLGGWGVEGCGDCAPARWRFPPLLRSQARILLKRGLERFLADGDPGLDGAAVLAALEQSL
jgi:hypothetical protein